MKINNNRKRILGKESRIQAFPSKLLSIHPLISILYLGCCQVHPTFYLNGQKCPQVKFKKKKCTHTLLLLLRCCEHFFFFRAGALLHSSSSPAFGAIDDLHWCIFMLLCRRGKFFLSPCISFDSFVDLRMKGRGLRYQFIRMQFIRMQD